MSQEDGSAASSLRVLSIMLTRIADSVERHEGQPVASARKPAASEAYRLEQVTPMLAAVAQNEYQSRKRRARYLDRALLSEPAWDMLLDLFVQKAAQRQVSATSAAMAGGAPYATMLRHFELLEQAGLIERTKSQTDARVTFVALTDEGFRRVGAYLHERANSIDLSLSAALRPAIPLGNAYPGDALAED